MRLPTNAIIARACPPMREQPVERACWRVRGTVLSLALALGVAVWALPGAAARATAAGRDPLAASRAQSARARDDQALIERVRIQRGLRPAPTRPSGGATPRGGGSK